MDAPTPLDASGCLIRLTWAVLGPGAMLITAAIIAQFRLPLGSMADAVFVAAVAAALVARSRERAAPAPAGAGPSHSVDLGQTSRRGYVIGLLVLAAVAYTVARLAVARAG